MRVYVLDDSLMPAPIGVRGELYLAGVGLARGYIGRPELTAQRFVADPFGAPGERMYRTGDIARWRNDGVLEYLGRNDLQVKIRGFRIELGEIEANLAGHACIDEAVVVARADAGGDKRLVAYYTAKDKIGAEDLRSHLSQRLPDFLVPAAYVQVAAFGLTPNGKLDRNSLPAPDDEAYARRVYEAPVGETEATLARIWAEVLRLPRVGRNDNFFELGGHSLLAAKMLEGMRRAGLQTDVRTIFAAATLQDLARAAAGQTDDAFEVPPNLIPADCESITPEMLPLVSLSQSEIDLIVATVPGGAVNVQDIYPLAPLQEGILFRPSRRPRRRRISLMWSEVSFDSRTKLSKLMWRH